MERKAFGDHMIHICSSVRRHFGGKFGICRPGEVEEREQGEEKRRRRGGGGKRKWKKKRRGFHWEKFDTNAHRRLCWE